MMTGASAMGIDSCPIEGFDSKKAQEFLKDELKIDSEEFGVSVMVAFGYRKDEPRDKSRLAIEDITTWYS
jgi:nitroreductase